MIQEKHDSMKIDFSQIEENAIRNFKGGEKETFVRAFADESNRILKGRLAPGASIGMHMHETSSETILITYGCGCVIDDGVRVPLETGDVHYCPKGHCHSLVNDSDNDMGFFAVVPQQ